MSSPSQRSVGDVAEQTTLEAGIWPRVLKGIGANVVGRFIAVGTAFVLPPLFLQSWEVNDYGNWLILASIAAYLSISDIGGQLYVINRMTQAYAKNDIAEFRALLHTGLALFTMLPAFFYILLCVVLSLGDPAALFGLSGISRDIVFFVLLLLAFRFVISLPQGLLLGVYRATSMLPRGVMLGNLMALLLLGFTSIALLSGAGLVAVAVVQILPMIIVGGIAFLDLSRKLKALDLFSTNDMDIEMGKSFVKPSLDFFLMYLAQAVSVQGVILVVGALFDSVQVVVFATLRTVANFLQQSIPIISHAVWPELTRFDMQSESKKLCLLLQMMLRSSLLFGMFFLIVVHYFGESGYRYWLNGKVEYNHFLMDLFLVYVMQTLFWTLCSNLLMASNKHKALSRMVLLNSLLSIFFGWAGGSLYGIEGVVMGLIASGFLLPLWSVMYLLKKTWPVFSFGFFAQELFPLIAAMALSFSGLWLAGLSLLLLSAWCLLSFRNAKQCF